MIFCLAKILQLLLFFLIFHGHNFLGANKHEFYVFAEKDGFCGSGVEVPLLNEVRFNLDGKMVDYFPVFKNIKNQHDNKTKAIPFVSLADYYIAASTFNYIYELINACSWVNKESKTFKEALSTKLQDMFAAEFRRNFDHNFAGTYHKNYAVFHAVTEIIKAAGQLGLHELVDVGVDFLDTYKHFVEETNVYVKKMEHSALDVFKHYQQYFMPLLLLMNKLLSNYNKLLVSI